jgi:tripartite-type tricarboxylate transporter receptor subunit TctC
MMEKLINARQGHQSRRVAGALVGVLASLVASVSMAQEVFPSKAITILHGSTPGGSTDIVARAIATGMSDRIGQPVVVESRAGGGGLVMLGALARAKNDGYTLGIPIGPLLTQAPHIYKDLTYDTFKDFVPITKIGDQATMIVTLASSPAKNVGELIAAAKNKELSVAVFAPINKIILGAISSATGAKFIEVPFPGLPQAAAALQGGHLDASFESPNTSLGAVKEGRYRAMVVTTAKRSSMQPDVPTVSETLIPGFDFGIWYGLLAPVGTPADRIDRIYRDTAASLQLPKVRETMTNAALEVANINPKDFTALIKSEFDRDGAIIRKYNIK